MTGNYFKHHDTRWTLSKGFGKPIEDEPLVSLYVDLENIEARDTQLPAKNITCRDAHRVAVGRQVTLQGAATYVTWTEMAQPQMRLTLPIR